MQVTDSQHSQDDLWECDGCGRCGTEAELEPHILAQPMDTQEDVKCWGLMKVGSDIWHDFHNKGIHPMSYIAGKVVEAVLETGIDLKLREDSK